MALEQANRLMQLIAPKETALQEATYFLAQERTITSMPKTKHALAK
jgi:hypothetical protein